MSAVDLNSFVANATTMREAEAKLASARGGGWLIALAQVLGKIADNMGEAIVAKAKEIDTAGPDADNINELNAELTAMSQVFKMFMEAASTVIKTIGEGNASMARKQ
ncbi:hypothetical protein WCE34_04650 [Luteimonas sp. MJ204]|uniref:hypothetical protein n=1 Tax=Luteimonas sp. MJ145 TaxID=3129234 RepID=UPI0031BA71C5